MGLSKSPLLAAHGLAGATFVEAAGWLVPASFGSVEGECAAVRTAAGLYDLADRGVVSLVGPDARRFCNGMFTNNVRDLAVGRGNASAMVDERARVQGLLRLYHTGTEAFLAVLEGVTPEAFEARYGKYIIFDDVELTDVSEQYGVLSVQGPDAAATLRRAGLPVPEGEGALVSVEALHVATNARSVPGGYDIVAPRDALPALWAGLLGAGAEPVGLDAREVLRIEAGIPRWPVDMSEKSLIHELRLVPTHASFEKGCYIGQEVINRIDVMGQVTKKIWGLEMGLDALPPAGAEVKIGEDIVGTVLSGAREGTRVRVLALLRKAAWEPGKAVEVHAAGRIVPATVSDLPFST
ncbi:MAG: glycine cleavage T C-terminal barrel domain-containing protein [Pseudomonadota bacterium]|nr:glycine cleavage T C-terminal barrel domain-containing protein [Pseudomonadota bacterium]